MDNLLRTKEKGGAAAHEEEVPRRSAPKVRKKKRKRDSDDDDDEDEDYTPSMEEKTKVRRFKRPKSQAATKLASQVNNHIPRNSLDARIPGVPLSFQPAEQNRANVSMGLQAVTSTKGQMPGQIYSIPDALQGDRFDFRYLMTPFVTTANGPMLRDVLNTPTADACRELNLRSNSSTGLPDREGKRQEKQENFISSSADVYREYSLRSNSSMGPPNTECKRQGKQKKVISSNTDASHNYSLRSSSSSDTSYKSQE